MVLPFPQVDDTTFLQRKSPVVGLRVLHVPDEMGDFRVTHKNKGLLLSQRAEELFPMEELDKQ